MAAIGRAGLDSPGWLWTQTEDGSPRGCSRAAGSASRGPGRGTQLVNRSRMAVGEEEEARPRERPGPLYRLPWQRSGSLKPNLRLARTPASAST